MKECARDSAGVSKQFKSYLQDAINRNGDLLDKVLKKSPFNENSDEYRNLKISVLLSSIQILKNKNKLDATNQSVILWHLPKSMSSYTKILLKEFFMELKLEIMECYREANLSDFDLENILDSAPEVSSNEEQY